MECNIVFQAKMDLRLLTIGITCFLVMLGQHAFTMLAYAQSVPSVQFTSLEWPPYTAPQLARQGATSAVVSAAMASMGYRVEVTFYPWNRAVALVRGRSSYIGYFPEYRSEEANSNFLLSDPIGSGPLGLAEHVDAPVHWDGLDDLAYFQVGVVTGYINTDGFDDRVRRGRQRVDYASSDKQNLLKLAAKRVSLAVIDRRVFDYLTRHDPQVAAVARKLRFNARLLESKHLYICFRRTPEGEHMRKIFNEGLKKIDVDATMGLALKEILDTP
ncbi:transporter substrate-binding domain-containing protein [Massilia sp. SR12]